MDQSFKNLLESLITESFARENRFGDKTLDEVGSFLEQAKEKYESPNPDPAILEDIKQNEQSYERSKEIYCEILLDVEIANLKFDPNETLSALAESGSRTVFSRPPLAVVESLPALEEAQDGDQDEPDTGEWPRDLGLLDSETDLPALPETESQPAHVAESDEGQAYLALAHFINSLKTDPTFPVDSAYLHRLISQNLCFALEAECAFKLEPAFKAFWKVKETAIRSPLNEDSKRFELQPAIRKAIEKLAEDHALWLHEGKFSIPALLNSLHFFVTTKADNLQPSLMEASVILLLFGQSTLKDHVALANYLGLPELTPEETLEAAFRLSRVQKLKNKAISVHSIFQPEHRETLEEDLARLFALLAKLTVGNAITTQRTA